MKYIALKINRPNRNFQVWFPGEGEYVIVPEADAEKKAAAWKCDIAGEVQVIEEKKKPKVPKTVGTDEHVEE